jgi:hypothetical protein
VFFESSDPNRDAADEVFVQLDRNTDPDYPTTSIFDISTTNNSISSTTDIRNLGPTSVVDVLDADAVDSTDISANTVTATTANIDDVTAANSLTDAAGISHTSELAESSDPVTDFPVGTVNDGDFVRNENGTLVGETRVRNVAAKGSVNSQFVTSPSDPLQVNQTDIEEDASIIAVDTSNDRLTIKQQGTYQVIGNLRLTQKTTTTFLIEKNGSQIIVTEQADSTQHSVTAIIDVSSPPAQITATIEQSKGTNVDTPTSLAIVRHS